MTMANNVLDLPELKDKNSRSGFDLSNKVLFTSKFGEILPVQYWECLPGDKFKINLNTFIRTASMESASFTRMRQYYNFYFVPYRLLWRDFPSFIVNRADSLKQANSIEGGRDLLSSLPYISGQFINKKFNNAAEYSVTSSKSQQTPYESNPRLTPDNQTVYFEYDSSAESDSMKEIFPFNAFGFNRGALSAKLLQYLGYGGLINYSRLSSNETYSIPSVNAFPLLAYQKIYSDYFRNTKWEKEDPSTYNVDYLGFDLPTSKIPIEKLFNSIYQPLSPKENMLDMRYCNYQKDMFTGVFPDSQYGATASVDVQSNGSLVYARFPFSLVTADGKQGTKYTAVQDNNPTSQPTRAYAVEQGGTIQSSAYSSQLLLQLGLDNKQPNSHLSTYLDNLGLNFDILSLRLAEAQQRFAEISLTNDSDYKSQIEAHFGVNVSSLMSSLCDYIGGVGQDINTNVVPNTNLSQDSSVILGAYGTSSSNKELSFDVKEHGIIMCVSYAIPLLEYNPIGYNPLVLKSSYTDFAFPEFDSLGLEQEPILWLRNHSSTTKKGAYPLPVSLYNGYSVRYVDYKTNVDKCLGDFATFDIAPYDLLNNLNGTLKSWSLNLHPNNFPLMLDYASMLDNTLLNQNKGFSLASRFAPWMPTYMYYKVCPSVVDNIFAVQAGQQVSSDVLRHSVFFDVKVVRNLSRSAFPY